MIQRINRLFGCLLFAVVCTGCIPDERYDLSRLDTEMTILKGKEFPVPDFSFQLRDIIDLDKVDYIRVDDNGDYILHFDFDPVDLQVYPRDIDADGRLFSGFRPVSYALGKQPDFLSGQDGWIVPDLSDFYVTMSLSSDFPGWIRTGCSIQTLKSESVTHTYNLSGLLVDWGYASYSFCENPTFASDIMVPELSQFLTPFPDAIRLNELDLQTDPDFRNLMEPDQGYALSIRTQAETPLVLAPDQRFTVTLPVDASLNLEQVGLKKAELRFTCENTIPLDFTIKAYALDADGNRIDDIRFTVPDTIRALNYTYSYLELSTQGDLRFDKLVLELTASSVSETAGKRINQNHQVRFYDVSLVLPDGITIRLDEPAE